MIIKGKSRGGGTQLGHYLEDVGENERIDIVEIRGTVSQEPLGALKEMEAYAEGTKCQNALYHAMVCPQPGYELTPEQFIQSIELLEKELGLEGQPRVVVAHEKEGSEHRHIVWSRIDLNEMKAIPDSHNYAKHEKVARELERLFGHPRVQGAHAERDGQKRPDRSPSRSELRQEERTGIKGADVRDEVTALFRASDGAEAFKSALEDQGYILAKGDRRDYVIIDRAGGTHSLGRRIEGVNAAELREFMKPLTQHKLPGVEHAKDIQYDRSQGTQTVFDELRREDAITKDVLKNASEAERKDWLEKRDNKLALAWDDQLIAAAEKKAKLEDKQQRERDLKVRSGRRTARNDALLGQAYSRGDDFASQTLAAGKHNKIRNKKLNEGPLRPEAHHKKTALGQFEIQSERVTERVEKAAKEKEELLRRQAEATTKEQQSELEAATTGKPKPENSPGHSSPKRALTRMERIQNALIDEERARETGDPDRQREASGRGRTRSR